MSISQNKTPLFVFELANNHMGDVDHGLRVIQEFSNIANTLGVKAAFKLQFRELDSFIHPDFKSRDDIKYIKRFSETKLDRLQFRKLINEIKKHGLSLMCTPFDEASVDQIVEEGFDILKIASCSFTDWPLLEKIAATNLPIIGSTAGAITKQIDQVVSFMSHRGKDFSLMQCVAEYPTPSQNLQLNQIDYLINRYPDIRIGYSTHENPDEILPVAMAIAKGASIFEKHVGIETNKYTLNNYSANPDQVKRWIEAAKKAYVVAGACGSYRNEPTNDEISSLTSLRRGVFASRDIAPGERLNNNDVFFAIPVPEDGITANDWSKYTQYYTTHAVKKGAGITYQNSRVEHTREKVYGIVQRVKSLLEEAKIVVPGEAEMEISHHYGLDKFDDYGITMITVVNREYCKKLIAVLPGQKHPEQFHNKKEETFHVLHGELRLTLDGNEKTCKPGDVIVIERGMKHAFDTSRGAVFEEISSTHFTDDSHYTDSAIADNKNRKTILRYWLG
jgi:sialic acid synthase SpsE/quercetin dioxygenase-like cupin family protein